MLNENKRVSAAVTAALLPLLSISLAEAQGTGMDPLDQVVVTATRATEGTRADLLGASFTILQSVDLEQRQTRYVSDILRDVPGVAVSRSGSLGSFTQIRMRGAEANHTLVLIDGMEASDPYFGEFDFATLIADDIARVEVLRGQQSALYGSDAIGGVINYITLSGREAPGGRVRVEGGSFGTTQAAARYAGVAGDFDYALSAGYADVEGFPVARFGTRDIGTENSVVSGRFEYEPADTVRFKAVVRYSRTDADSPDQESDFSSPRYGLVIDGGGRYENRALYGLVRAEMDSLDGHWTNTLSAQGVDASRDNFDDGDYSGGDNGRRLRYSYVSTLRFGSDSFSQTLTGAVDHERENFQNLGVFLTPQQSIDRQITTKGLVAQYDARIDDRIGLGAAIRHDDNDRFDDDTTFRLQGSYRLDAGTRLRAAAGSGIKNPGIFELFGFDPGTFIGNSDLKPEKSIGWEVGADRAFADGRGLIGVTYFNNELKDEIATEFLPPDFDARPYNLSTESTQKGVEVFLQERIDAWRVDASYTYVDSKQDGVEEVRRPRHLASLNVGYRALADRLGIAVTVRYNGGMNDNDFRGFTPTFVRLHAYTLVNVGGDFKLTENVQLYGRVENVLNERYEEVFSYRSAGLGAYAGAHITF